MPNGQAPYVPGYKMVFVGLMPSRKQIPCRLKLMVSWDRELWMEPPDSVFDIDAVANIGMGSPIGLFSPAYDGPTFAIPPGMFWRVDVIGDIDDE